MKYVRFCIKNGVPDTTEDKINRLNENAHPKEFINDGNPETSWISADNIYQAGGFHITIDLENEYEVGTASSIILKRSFHIN